ncbi:DUF4185 domain-containing protein [Rhodococcus sp. D2-41]|uniref:hypothetical protein n=1 Tax=Speluncibacter jeojiensis TaxID=2710754 RepID=UPI00240F5378|nr:hypothetical protein [Rhodococcus sp. D2-41]MDG3010240.1 DUF4185 domain-containing protein [Rhodococcus sp. D2-41]
MAQGRMSRRMFGRLAALSGAGLALVGRPGIARAATDPREHERWFLEPDSAFFATAAVEYAAGCWALSTGDLWPSCWADDDQIYAANGDGMGFGLMRPADLVVNRIAGTPEQGLRGTRLADSDAVAQIYADPAEYNRKPTGIAAVDGDGDGRDELYLAVQDLRFTPAEEAFNDAPNAAICRSDDHGRHWRIPDTPMFDDHVFTTIMFLDFGKSQQHARVLGPEGSGYLYAYGLDGNWRGSYSDTVPDPTCLYLARVPRSTVQQRETWQFFAGLDQSGAPRWSAELSDRVAVLTDGRIVYPRLLHDNGPKKLSVLSQGGVVYNAPLRRYLYTSWTEYTFQFYEAPTPWGPWRLFLTHDAGGYPWYGRPLLTELIPSPFGHPIPQTLNQALDLHCPGPKNGGYGCTIPSKFIGDDGTEMWVQSNWFVGDGCGAPNYSYSLRRLRVAQSAETEATNPSDSQADLARVPGTVPVQKSAHYGHGDWYSAGRTDRSEDSFDNSPKTVDFWGYTWDREYRLDRLVYTTGDMFDDGGWFAADLTVQVRRSGRWQTVSGTRVEPRYPYVRVGKRVTYTWTFSTTVGDGIRIHGTPGGSGHFTSIAALAVHHDGVRTQ